MNGCFDVLEDALGLGGQPIGSEGQTWETEGHLQGSESQTKQELAGEQNRQTHKQTKISNIPILRDLIPYWAAAQKVPTGQNHDIFLPIPPGQSLLT